MGRTGFDVSTKRLQSSGPWPWSGKALARTETLQSAQRDSEICLVRFDVECLAEGGVHRKASRDSSMSSHTGRRHSPTLRILDRTDQDDIRGGAESREVGGRTWTDVSDSGVGRRMFSRTRTGMENTTENETRGDGTSDTEECNSSQHWRLGVRRPGNTTVDETSLGTEWSRCAQRNVSGIHADHNVETLEHDSASTTNPQKLLPNVFVK